MSESHNISTAATEDEGSPGWDAINGVLRPIYGDTEPLHWGTMLSHRLGGPDPLDGISAYRRTEPVSHLHYVTYGFSELYEKESEALEVSGFGFELTFRLRVSDATSAEPPNWVLNFLQNLARYVFSSGNPFSSGDHMHLNGPIALDEETQIHAIAFAYDPELPPVETPNGRVEFLQIVGITTDELSAIKSWRTAAFLDLAGAHLPLLTTDPSRRSLLEDPAFGSAVERGRAVDGSSTGFLFTDTASWQVERGLLRKPRLEITLGIKDVAELGAILPGRVPFGKELTIGSRKQTISFVPGDGFSWATGDDGKLRLTLTADAARQFASVVLAREGRYEVPLCPGLAVLVAPSWRD